MMRGAHYEVIRAKRLYRMVKVHQIDRNICFRYYKSEQMMWKRKINSWVNATILLFLETIILGWNACFFYQILFWFVCAALSSIYGTRQGCGEHLKKTLNSETRLL